MIGAWAMPFEACLDYFPNRTPPIVTLTRPGQHKDLCMSGFAILHSGESKTPVFVVEKLNRERLKDAQDEDRKGMRFYEEARLPIAHRARLTDYQGSGYDRGHMAPAADMPTPEAMAQSFSLANMIPQAPELNRGIWARNIEAATRKYAMRAKGDIYVFTGPAFDEHPPTIGAGRVWIPAYCWKLVHDPTAGKTWVHWIENRNDARMRPPITYEEFTRRLPGLDLLPTRGKSPLPPLEPTAGPTPETLPALPPGLPPETRQLPPNVIRWLEKYLTPADAGPVREAR